ncbi:MAG TPA: DUF1931 family protein [Candidatus Limnocylindrales bacterium]|nr:DUF1931 family protein [Candidatus Limnocylindrales bacterium]
MAVTGLSHFERFFRETADLDVDKSDEKRYREFVRHKIADLLVIGEARAKADGRDIIERRDLPITKGLQETIHQFRRERVAAEVRPLLGEIATVPMLDLDLAAETEESLPEIAGGLSLALGRTFKIVDPELSNPSSDDWERAFRLFDLLL